jgi:hypothetical protein
MLLNYLKIKIDKGFIWQVNMKWSNLICHNRIMISSQVVNILVRMKKHLLKQYSSIYFLFQKLQNDKKKSTNKYEIWHPCQWNYQTIWLQSICQLAYIKNLSHNKHEFDNMLHFDDLITLIIT